jgi:hypothetical protein
MEVVLFSIPLNLLVGVRRTEQRTLFGPSLATNWGYKCLRVLSQVESSGCLAVMAMAHQKIHLKIVLNQDLHKEHALIDSVSRVALLFHLVGAGGRIDL